MEELSDNAKKWLKFLGHFGVTTRGDEVKGWMHDFEDGDVSKVYLDAEGLLEFSSALVEVAGKLKKSV